MFYNKYGFESSDELSLDCMGSMGKNKYVFNIEKISKDGESGVGVNNLIIVQFDENDFNSNSENNNDNLRRKNYFKVWAVEKDRYYFLARTYYQNDIKGNENNKRNLDSDEETSQNKRGKYDSGEKA